MSNSSPLLNQIDHIVVLMLENRSFDNVLGWLYDPENKPPFDKVPRDQPFAGLSGKKWCNPRPPIPLRPPGSGSKSGAGEACAARGTVMTDPYPDPHEPYNYVYTQMFNEICSKDDIPNRTDTPSMQGFVNDYADAIKKAGKVKSGCSRILASLFKSDVPMDTDPGIIMNGFAPASLPVINGLANAYAVCDHWFSSVPTQTFPNRSFVHASTSSGYVYNKWKTGEHPWDIGILINKTPTIYNLLEKAGISWRIYYGSSLLLCNALLIQDQLWELAPFDDRISSFRKFKQDAKEGNLPSYTFIEPNFMCSGKYGPENDMHPAYAAFDTGNPTNALYGDSLIWEVYQALLNGPHWDRTLFVITFDEHGGTFDHVGPQPPLPVSPDGVIVPASEPGGSGFDFQRYGVRVPAVLVSPMIKQGTVCNTIFDHTSIIRTVANRWLGPDVFLTQRDKLANDVSEVLTQSPDLNRPEITPNPVPPFTGCSAQRLSGLHLDMLAAAAHQAAKHTGETIELDPIITTDDAVAALDALEEKVRNSIKLS